MKRFIYSFIASLPTLLLSIVLLLFTIKSIQLFYGFFFFILTVIIFVGLFMILKDEFKPKQKRSSENLYKYMVTMGLLLMVLTVYYPLKEKQELEIITVNLRNDVKTLNLSIIQNKNDVELIKGLLDKQGHSKENNSRLIEIEKLNKQNQVNQLQTESKYSELIIRKKYISIYNYMFIIFFPLGILLTIYGFVKWKKSKKYDDNILKLENEKLEIEVEKLKNN